MNEPTLRVFVDTSHVLLLGLKEQFRRKLNVAFL
jgi:hypothetical protein